MPTVPLYYLEKCEKNIAPPPQTTPTFEIQNQNKGIEDIMDIDPNCPSLLFGEATSQFEIQNQNKGIEDTMDIDANCPSLLFGETTSHLTSK